MKKSIVYKIAVIGIVCAAGCGNAGSIPKEDTEELSELSGFSGESGAEAPSKEESGKEQEGTGDALVYVQISGAVAKPGVYSLPEGSRVFEAVELAGGMTEEADFGSLNQAETVKDGQMIKIPTAEEASRQEAAETEIQQQDGKVDLNTATEEQLMTLPGIGASKAKSILAWREENGRFEQIEDLMRIEGIKEGVYAKIKDSIKVN